jgi:O-antigen/teichoic acid export membrane protein
MQLHKLLAAGAVVQGAGLLLTVLIGVQLARYLGAADYGTYGLAMAVISIASVVAQFGLPLFGTREAARPNANLRRLLGWLAPRSLAIALGVSLALSAILVLAAPQWLQGREGLIVLIGALVAGLALQATVVGVLRGSGRNVTGQIVDLLLRPALIVVAIFVLHRAASVTVTAAMGVQLGAVLFCLMLSLALVLGPRPEHSPSESFHFPRWTVTSSTYMTNGLLGALNGSYPMIVAGLFISGPELGVLRVALSAAILLDLPATVANITAAPLLARQSAAGDRRGLAHTVSHTTTTCFALTLCGWLVLLLAGKSIIAAVFGTEYVGAHVPLLILGAGQLIIAAFGVSNSYLNLTAREGLVTRAFLLSVPLGIASSIVLVRLLGLNGAAMGPVVMAATWHVYVFGFRRREIDAPMSLVAALTHIRELRRPCCEP